MEWKRKENEDIRDYKVRLAINKDIYGLTWLEICDILNEETGEKYGESAYRKELTNYIKGINYQIEKSLERNDGVNKNQAILDEINEKLLEIKKEKVKLQTEKIEYNKWIREVSRAELFEEKIVEAIERNMKVLDFPNREVNVNSNRSKAMVLAFGDIHFGKELKIVDFQGNIINEFNEEIFKKRMWKIFHETIDKAKRENVNKVYIFNNGDNIEGILKAGSQLMSLKYGIIDGAIKFMNFMGQYLNEMSKHLHVVYHQVTANHEDLRIVSGKKGDYPHENIGKMIVWGLEAMLKGNPCVEIIKEQNQGLIYTNIIGFDFLMTHGDKDRDLEKAVKDYSQFYGINIDYLIVGHKHFSNVINFTVGKEIFQIPSVVGCCEYAQTLKKSSDPSAKIMIFEEGIGRTVEYVINLKNC